MVLVNNIFVLGYTFRVNLDEYAYIHSSELLSILERADRVAYSQKAQDEYIGTKTDLALEIPTISPEYVYNNFDAILLPSQYSSERMLDLYPTDLYLIEHIGWCKKLFKLWGNKPVYIVEQDPRPEFIELYDEFPNAKILTTHKGYEHIGIDNEWLDVQFGLQSAKYTQGELFSSMPIVYNGTVFAANSYDVERARMLDKYATEGTVIVGKCLQYNYPNVTKGKTISYDPLKYAISSSAYQLVLYSKHHIARGFWQTTRLFQAMAWGSLCLVPIEYRDLVPKWFLPDEFFVANKQDVLDKLINHRAELICKQYKIFEEYCLC